MRASCVWVTVVAAMAGCIQESPDEGTRPPPSTASRARAGTVETIAGPGYCAGTSIRDSSSEEVGALDLDGEGRIYFDTGPRADGFVARVDRDGRLTKIRHLTHRGPYEQDPAKPEAPAAGRLAADGAGGVFIAAGSKVVHLDRQGALRNIAGDPKHPPSATGSGSSGDGGPAEAARFSSARSLITDETGNLYLADQHGGPRPQMSVRFINRSAQPVSFFGGTPGEVTIQPGHIRTIAGETTKEGTGGAKTIPGGSSVLALKGPSLYVATSLPGAGRNAGGSTVTLINLSNAPLPAHGQILKPGGAKKLLPQESRPDERREGGPGSSPGPRESSPEGPAVRGPITALAADPAGNLYLADSGAHRVLKVNAAGVRELFAGAGGRQPAGFNGNDRRARGAQLNRPYSLVPDPGGRLYIADRLNHQVRFVDEAGVIRAAPGAGIGLQWRCSGSTKAPGPAQGNKSGEPAEATESMPLPGAPSSVAADGKGNTYFTNSSGNQVKIVDPAGRVRNVAGDRRAGNCNGRPGGRPENRPVSTRAARLRSPNALAVGSGGIYVTDCDNARISFINSGSARLRVNGITSPPRSMITVAGSGKRGFSGDGKKATAAELGGSAGSRLPSPASPIVEDPNAIQPNISFGALATDAKRNVYIADTGNGRIRMVDRSGVITTIAGEGMPGSGAECCRRPSGLAVDRTGNLYVLDVATLKVWFLNRGKVPLTVKGVSVPPASAAPVAGNGGIGFEGEGGPATQAQLLFPMGVALDRQENLYIVEVSAALGRTLFDPVLRGVDVRRVDAGGRMRTILGPGHAGFNGDGLKPNLTSLSFPTGIGTDRCGNLLIADLGSDRIRRVNLQNNCG